MTDDALDSGAGLLIARYEYDGLSRRIVRTLSNSGDLNATYHDYYDGQRLVETRSGGTSGGGLVIRHQVWGLQYIDELVQVTVNRALLDDPDMDASDPDHDVQVVYAVLDPMFSLLGLVDASGDLIERYELDPYGRRQVFGPADVNDTTLTLALNSPARVEADTVEQPYALTDVSHQGLPLDENTSLLYNRARYRNPATGRFISRDPLGYPDGMNGYAAWHIATRSVDPNGLKAIRVDGNVTSWPSKNHGGPPEPHFSGQMWVDSNWSYNYSFAVGCQDGKASVSDFDPGDVNWTDRPESIGFSVLIAGVTVSDISRNYILYSSSEAVDCEKGRAQRLTFVVRTSIKVKRSAGLNPGLGPFSWDVGMSLGRETQYAIMDTTYQVSCCCLNVDYKAGAFDRPDRVRRVLGIALWRWFG